MQLPGRLQVESLQSFTRHSSGNEAEHDAGKKMGMCDLDKVPTLGLMVALRDLPDVRYSASFVVEVVAVLHAINIGYLYLHST